MILIICLYKIRIEKRLEEIKFTFLNNLNNKFIEKIIVFFEEYEIGLKEYEFLINPKTKIIPTKDRQTYNMLIDYGKKNYLNEKIIISNADIMFDGTINRVNEVEFNPKKLIMLTRWEVMKDVDNKLSFQLVIQKNKQETWSFDVIIFEPNLDIDVTKFGMIKVGISACDSYLLQKFREQKILVVNPCLDIRTFHFHFEEKDRISNLNGFTYWKESDYNNKLEGIKPTTVDGLMSNNKIILKEI